MGRSLQPVLVAYHKNVLTRKLVTSQVVEWPFFQIPEKSRLCNVRVITNINILSPLHICMVSVPFFILFLIQLTGI